MALDDDALRQRNTLFQAISWLGSEGEAPATGGAPASDTAAHLRTLYSTTRTTTTARGGKETVTRVNTAEAAKALKVSQRTVQRWLKGEHSPKPDTMTTLKTKARQAVTTKRGRERTVRRARENQQVPPGGVKVGVTAQQGPVTTPATARSSRSSPPKSTRSSKRLGRREATPKLASTFRRCSAKSTSTIGRSATSPR